MQLLILRTGAQTTAVMTALGAAATLLFTSSNGRWALYQVDVSSSDIETIRKNCGASYIAGVFAQLP